MPAPGQMAAVPAAKEGDKSPVIADKAWQERTASRSTRSGSASGAAGRRMRSYFGPGPEGRMPVCSLPARILKRICIRINRERT